MSKIFKSKFHSRKDSEHSHITFWNKSRGMTLAEVLVAMSIMVIVMLAVVSFQVDVINYNRQGETTLTNIQDATNILKYMSRELRTMVPSASGSYPILTVATSSIVFFADVEGDGTIEQVRYYFDSSSLKRGVTEPTGSPQVYTQNNESINTIATGVRNATSSPLFEYFDGSYDGNGSSLSYPISIFMIRLVKINIMIDTDQKKSPLPVIYSTQVSLRNLKDNI